MKSVILLSGGIDSTVALAVAQAQDVEVNLAISFFYGQTHAKEIDAAAAVAAVFGVEHKVIDLSQVLDGPSALTHTGTIPTGHAESVDATFVPGRNLVMVSAAVAAAASKGYGAVVVGANADDNAGYPDCRPSFIQSLDAAARAGYGVSVWAPLLRMNKQQIVETGRRLSAPLDLTWSCYRGGSAECRNCGACQSKIGAGL